MGAPAGWIIEKCGCGTCWSGFSPAQQQVASAAAILFMWAATGRRYGIRTMSIQPHNPRSPEPLYRTYPVSDPFGYALAGPGLAWLSGVGAGCSHRCEVELPGPVVDIVEVRVDGVPVDAVYEIQNGRLLVRTDGLCWPTCQTYGAAVPGFEVDYHAGRRVPDEVQRAAELLACEYASDCAGGECRLPARLRSITRQGVSVDMEEVDVEELGKLRTGIKAVDDIIAADNPYGLTEPRQIVSPDDPPARTVTWSAAS